MAEVPKLVTIDPNGDTLLKLKDIRWKLPEWIDEATRFAPSVNGAGLPEATAAEAADKNDQCKHPDQVHFLVSSRQLRLVSTYFDAMFKRDYAESIADPTDGKYHIWATEWNPVALKHLMNMAHARVTDLPNCNTLDEVVEMALIVDYYGMREVPMHYVKNQYALMRAASKGHAITLGIFGHGPRAIKMMFLSLVFKGKSPLERTLELAMKASKGPLQELGLPLGNIPDKLEEHRQQAIKAIIEPLDNLVERLKEGKECCSFACRASLLGTLILLKQSGGLTSTLGVSISSPYYGTSLQGACDAVRAMTVRKPSKLMSGKTVFTFEPLGVCDKCDLKFLFDNIMKKVNENLAFKLDLSSYKLV